jgi:hypothetical protein
MTQKQYILIFVFVIALHLNGIKQNIQPSHSEYLTFAWPFNQFYTFRLGHPIINVYKSPFM